MSALVIGFLIQRQVPHKKRVNYLNFISVKEKHSIFHISFSIALLSFFINSTPTYKIQ